MNKSKTEVIKDLKEKTILISREFHAAPELVWRAFTESELLDQWWAPAPWRAETKTMQFKTGGYWLYAMVSPENEKHWGRMNYTDIQFQQSFDLEDFFCDEQGLVNSQLPVSRGKNIFTPSENGTRVEFRMQYPTEADIQKIVEMGFEQGITACFDQLEALLQNKMVK